MPAVRADEEFQCYIGGEWRAAGGGATFESENPANGETLGRFPLAGAADVDLAVAAAVAVYRDRVWWDLDAKEKQRRLRAVASLLRDRADALAHLISAEVGKPMKWAAGEVLVAADCFEYYAGLVRDIGGRTLTNLRHDLFAFTVKEPAGVAALVTPWNFPLVIAAQKVAPALAAGCPVVLKPAPQTPRVSVEFARLFDELAFPGGLVNVVTDSGPGSPAGERLSVHPDVAVVSFTGSVETARRVAAAAAGTLKRVVLECGGKSPMIVHRDADLDAAVDGALFGIYFNTGQVCNASSRLFLHEDVADDFVARFVPYAQALRVGDPAHPDTQVGPVISSDHLERVLSYVDLGTREGAALVCGGSRLHGDGFDAGYYLEPTVFDDVDQSMRIAQEEIFGPVLAVSRFTDVEQAIDDANATPYGLAGSIWTQDLRVADTVRRRLQVGSVWVNECSLMFPEAPHGGYGMSGTGREMGPEALLEFQETKSVIQKTLPGKRARSFLTD
jgi:acyl-CoA reductase-like NAD-dependent aldehyde dehydrogenase